MGAGLRARSGTLERWTFEPRQRLTTSSEDVGGGGAARPGEHAGCRAGLRGVPQTRVHPQPRNVTLGGNCLRRCSELAH